MSSETYRLAVASSFGGPEVIKIENVPTQGISPRGVRVAVRANGLNPVDARRRAGTFGGQPPLIFGTEYAGVIIESNDSAWPVGTEVIGWGTLGASGDLVTTDGTRIARKPAELDWLVAAGISGAGQTSLTALNKLPLKQGDTIVIHGAAGGVGTMLTQIAVDRGYNVIGTAGPSNLARLTTLGATAVQYGPGLSERLAEAAAGKTIKASIDLAGSAEAGDFATALMRKGGQAITLVPETMMSHSIRLVSVEHSPANMEYLLKGFADGTFELPVTALPLAQIVEAHRQMDSKHASGKLVLDLADNPFLPENA